MSKEKNIPSPDEKDDLVLERINGISLRLDGIGSEEGAYISFDQIYGNPRAIDYQTPKEIVEKKDKYKNVYLHTSDLEKVKKIFEQAKKISQEEGKDDGTGASEKNINRAIEVSKKLKKYVDSLE